MLSAHLFLQYSPFLSTTRLLESKTKTSSSYKIKPTRFTICSSSVQSQKQDIVIVGAGIAGLATAVALHRLGVESAVLEQAESLRTGGTSLTLFKNGWRVLDALGVGDYLRTQFLEIQGCTGWQ